MKHTIRVVREYDTTGIPYFVVMLDERRETTFPSTMEQGAIEYAKKIEANLLMGKKEAETIYTQEIII